MRRLTKGERAIRRSRGIPIPRLLPFAMPVIAVITMSTDQQLFHECIGRTIEGASRGAGWVRVLVAIPCSGYYLREFPQHWIVITMFFAGIALAVPQVFWLKRHKAYWDVMREKERIRRAEKSARKRAMRESHSDTDDPFPPSP